MWIEWIRENDYVVQVHKALISQNAIKDVIHDSLERRWGVDETKRHLFEFVMIGVCREPRFWSILWLDWNLVKSLSKIDSGKDLALARESKISSMLGMG